MKIRCGRLKYDYDHLQRKLKKYKDAKQIMDEIEQWYDQRNDILQQLKYTSSSVPLY